MPFATPTLCTKCDGTGRLESEVTPFTFKVPSPVPALVGTNHTPSDSEADAIRDTISELQPSISALDNDIAPLQATLTELRRKRQTLLSHIQEHKSLISAIRRFPAELLGEVFVRCLPERWQKRTFGVNKTPLLLTQVCRHWRAIAISTRELWSSFVYERLNPSDVSLTKLWLARGGNCTMNIRISESSVNTRDIWTVHQVLTLLVSHCERWRNLEIHLLLHMASVIAAAKDRLPVLRTLVIHPLEPYDNGSQVIDTFERAPLLRSFQSNELRFFRVNIPWAQLDELTMDANIDLAVAILGQAVNLSHFRLTSRPSFLEAPLSVLHHNQLRSLTLQISSPHSPFSYLTLPALQDICIIQGNTYSSQSQLICFLSRSKCSLRSFAFHNVPLTGGQLLECLEHAPSLLELKLLGKSSHSITDEVLHRLICRDTENAQVTCLTPTLQAIDIDAYDILNPSLFMDMVQSRSCIRSDSSFAISRLKKVAISFQYADGQLERLVFARARVRQLRDEGLDISIVQHFEQGPSIAL